MNRFPTINRFAVILIPTEACLDWVRSCPDGDDHMTLGEMQQEPTTYLIPETKRVPPEDWVRRHSKVMFHEELDSWCPDRCMWPKDLSFKTFKKFFEVNISTVVFDLGKGPIEKEDE
jgi:hypothetical protein